MKLKTNYVCEEIPHSEYPRPSMVRDSYICLNGTWNFGKFPADEANCTPTGSILVPFSPEASLSGQKDGFVLSNGEKLVYERAFTVTDEIKDKRWLKVLFIPGSVERRNELMQTGLEICGDTSDFNDSTANIYGSVKKYVEQMPKGVSKGTALKHLRSVLGIKEGCLFGIGDYYNDVEMLKVVDIPAVTLGAPDDLKQMAKYITCSCADGAVADFIDYLVKNFS